MIRLGNKPGVFFVPASNDMSHFFPSHYAHSEYFYVSDEMYLKFLEYTDPSLLALTKEDYDNIGRPEEEGFLQELLKSQKVQRIKRILAMNPNGTMLWQFNALASDMKSYIRHVAVFGERTFMIWSWFDAYIALPWNRFICNFLNRIRYFKVKREITDWNRFLENVHSKIGPKS